jgi:hypothetical protein
MPLTACRLIFMGSVEPVMGGSTDPLQLGEARLAPVREISAHTRMDGPFVRAFVQAWGGTRARTLRPPRSEKRPAGIGVVLSIGPLVPPRLVNRRSAYIRTLR